MGSYVVGVDGCRAGWLACVLGTGSPIAEFAVIPDFRTILGEFRDGHFIAIDIPIGLTEDGRARRCDLEARKLLAGPRASSVFPAPARPLLGELNYGSACAASRKLHGKAISKQSHAIFGKIAEVDGCMYPELQTQVIEVHPEVCFWGIAQSPMQHSKKSSEGFAERRQALRDLLPRSLPDRSFIRHETDVEAEPDDILDAAVAAVTARRLLSGKAKRIPAEPQFDARGLRMEMVY